jgi:hypothetical protein
MKESPITKYSVIFFCQPLASIKNIARISTTWNFLKKQSMVGNGTGLVSILKVLLGTGYFFLPFIFEGFIENYPFFFEGLQNILKGM